MIITNCCGTCLNAEYHHKKGKTVHCNLFDITAQQFQLCDCHQKDLDKVERIHAYLKTLD